MQVSPSLLGVFDKADLMLTPFLARFLAYYTLTRRVFVSKLRMMVGQKILHVMVPDPYKRPSWQLHFTETPTDIVLCVESLFVPDFLLPIIFSLERCAGWCSRLP